MHSQTESAWDGAVAAAGIPSMPPGVEFWKLENGLELILKEDHSAPVVSVQAWCRAGSVDEGPWLGAGLSHVLEHMLFKGTTTRGSGRIDQEVQSAGGYMNAYTSFDRTVYWINVPNTGARVAVDILCDIFQNATLPADELVKELDVIRREMDMGEDDPGRRSSRRLFETAYMRSPYRYPVIGLPDIFNRLTRDDIAAYYREKYAPNNCFIVVVGDFKAAEVKAQIQEAWKATRARPVPVAVLPEEPRQTTARQSIEDAPIELGHVHMAWHIPDVRHQDIPALDVLASLLGHGRSSRLYQAVREKAALAHSVSGWTYAPGMAGLIGVSAVCDGDKFEAVREAILAEVELVRRNGVSEDELAKARKQFIAGTLASRKSMEGQAQDLGGNWMLAHDLNFSERYLSAVKLLGTADIQRVARKYMGESQRVTMALLPQGHRVQTADALVSAQPKPVRKGRLSNGLRVLTKEDHRLPFVEIRVVFNGGLLSESMDDSGITQLMSRLLVKGTTRRTAEAIATEIESLGGSLDPYSGNHSFGLCTEVMREDLHLGMDLFADVLLNPEFARTSVERERQVQLAGIRGQRDQLLQSALKAMRRRLFGERGYGLDSLGEEAVVSRLGVDDVRRHYNRLVVPSNAVLSVFGDMDAEAVMGQLESRLGGWTGGTVFLPASEAYSLGTGLVEEERDKEQSVLVLGFPGTTFESEDRFVLELIQEICSDMGSRLFMRVRDELGLAYYVGASHFPGRVHGYFAFYCGTSPEKTEDVARELRAQAELLRLDGVTAEELARAKAKVIGQKKIASQDLGHQAMTSALDELYGLGFEFGDSEPARFEAVTLDQVRAVAAKYLQADKAVLSVVRGRGAEKP